MPAPVSTPFNRYMRSPTEITQLIAASGYQINQGDLCVFYSGLLYSVTAGYGQVISWNSGTELQNRSGARNDFAGVALGQNNSYSVVSGTLPVFTYGTFQYPYVATSGSNVAIGTYVSFTQNDPANPSNSGYFAQQALMQTSGNSSAIGRVVQITPANTSGVGSMVVDLQATLFKGTLNNL